MFVFKSSDQRLLEARVRQLESGRVLLCLEGFSDEYFDTSDALETRIEQLANGTRFSEGLCLDDEVARRKLRTDARAGNISLCGTQNGPVRV